MQTEAKEREGLARMFAGWGSRAIAAGGAAPTFEKLKDGKEKLTVAGKTRRLPVIASTVSADSSSASMSCSIQLRSSSERRERVRATSGQ